MKFELQIRTARALSCLPLRYAFVLKKTQRLPFLLHRMSFVFFSSFFSNVNIRIFVARSSLLYFSFDAVLVTRCYVVQFHE